MIMVVLFTLSVFVNVIVLIAVEVFVDSVKSATPLHSVILVVTPLLLLLLLLLFLWQLLMSPKPVSR